MGLVRAGRLVRQNFLSEFRNFLESHHRDVTARVVVQHANIVKLEVFFANLLQLGRALRWQ